MRGGPGDSTPGPQKAKQVHDYYFRLLTKTF